MGMLRGEHIMYNRSKQLCAIEACSYVQQLCTIGTSSPMLFPTSETFRLGITWLTSAAAASQPHHPPSPFVHHGYRLPVYSRPLLFHLSSIGISVLSLSFPYNEKLPIDRGPTN